MAELNEAALEAARAELEDVLIDFRDNGRFMIGGNGFVVRDKDGSDSSIMRLTTGFGLQIGIKAYLAALDQPEQCPHCTSPYRNRHFVMPVEGGVAYCSDAWHDQEQASTDNET